MKELLFLFILFSLFYLSQQTIRVAIVEEVCGSLNTCSNLAVVLSSNSSINAVVVSSSGWASGLVIASSYDVVILTTGSNTPSSSIPSSLGTAVQDFVQNYNGGLILTGWVYDGIASSSIYDPLNTVSAVQFNGYYDSFSSVQLQITATHPVTQGLGLGTVLPTIDYMCLSCAPIISGGISLGSVYGGSETSYCTVGSYGDFPQGIVVYSLGTSSGGRSAHLAPVYGDYAYAPPTTGVYETLLENTVFWVSGKKIVTTSMQTTQVSTTGSENSTTVTSANLLSLSQTSTAPVPVIVGVIIGVIGIIFLISLLIVVLFFHRKKENKKELNCVTLETFPDIPLSTTPSKRNSNEFLENVTIQELIASGNFGEVLKGKWQGIEVALKKTKKDHNKEFLNETKILKEVRHPNVVTFFGIYKSKDKSLYMVMEYLSEGSLNNFIMRYKESLSINEISLMMKQASIGMIHLVSKSIVHRDLSLRNLLIEKKGNELMVKVSDFGLSKILAEENYYKVDSGNNQFPVRWTSPEAISFGKFSHESDIWSFGITCWEAFSWGAIPYGGISNVQVIKLVCEEGFRLSKPKDCPEDIFELIKQSWLFEPSQRPTFDQFYQLFQKHENQKNFDVPQKKIDKSDFQQPAENHYHISNPTYM